MVAAPCRYCWGAVHQILYPVPGSVIVDWTGLGGWDDDLLEALPEDLLQREFELTLKAWEKVWIHKQSASLAESTSS